jgi:hypothetical protein
MAVVTQISRNGWQSHDTIYHIRDEYASQYTTDAFHYLGDVLSQNNIKFGYYADHIHPIGLEIRNTI